MTGLSLATKGVICGGNVSGPPPIVGSGGSPIRKEDGIIMPKIKVKSIDISKDKEYKNITEDKIKISTVSLVIDWRGLKCKH